MADSSLRVMFLVDTLGRGGVAAHFKMLLPELAARGATPCVVCLERDTGVGAELEALGIEVRHYALKRLRSTLALSMVRELRRTVREERWDIVASYLFSGCLIGAGVRWMNRHVRHVVAWRDTGFWLTGWYRRGMLFASRRADLLTANSSAVEAAIGAWLGPGHPPVRRILNAVHIPAEPAHPEGIFHIGMAARFSPEKGQEILVNAARILRERGREFRVTFAGDGPDFAHVRARVAALGLDDIMALPGMYADTRPLYRAIHVLAAPSRSEGFSNTILEAMAHGVPVVASDVGGNPELVRPGETGWLFPPGDATALADSLARLMDDDAARRRMGARAREIAATSYTPAIQAEAMLEALRALCAGRG